MTNAFRGASVIKESITIIFYDIEYNYRINNNF